MLFHATPRILSWSLLKQPKFEDKQTRLKEQWNRYQEKCHIISFQNVYELSDFFHAKTVTRTD